MKHHCMRCSLALHTIKLTTRTIYHKSEKTWKVPCCSITRLQFFNRSITSTRRDTLLVDLICSKWSIKILWQIISIFLIETCSATKEECLVSHDVSHKQLITMIACNFYLDTWLYCKTCQILVTNSRFIERLENRLTFVERKWTALKRSHGILSKKTSDRIFCFTLL